MNDKVFVYLREDSVGLWSIYNEQGIQLTSTKLNNEIGAMEWAKAWTTSWRYVEVKLDNGKEDRVPK